MDLLKNDKSLSVDERNLHILAVEIVMVRNDLDPEIMKNMIRFVQNPYNLRNYPTLQS